MKEKATKFKEEGNFYYKCKNYKKAVESYTKALKEKIDDDKELLSILHSNRAVAHYYLQNYRSALNDCVFARKFNPKNLKPIYKGAECCLNLKKYADCIQWCEMGLNVDPNDAKLKEMRSKAEIERVRGFIIHLSFRNNTWKILWYYNVSRNQTKETNAKRKLKSVKNPNGKTKLGNLLRFGLTLFFLDILLIKYYNIF